MTIFLLKITLAWGLFALFYTLLLRHETFFRANRAYLLGTAALGLLLALPADWLVNLRDEANLPNVVLPAISVGLQQTEAIATQWGWLHYLWIAYFVGAAMALVRLSWGLFQIARLIAQGEQEHLTDGCTLVKISETKAPFSFFKWVFVPNDAQLTEGYSSNAMLAHERVHAQDWHSADVLFSELLCVVFWFHPLAHWYQRSLRTVHEYLADAAASRLTDSKQYGLLLIRQAHTGISLAFVNHFFQSPLKQRLIMLTRSASPTFSAWKYGLTLPVFALLFLFACQKTSQEQANSDADHHTTSSQPATDRAVLQLFEVEQAPQFPGGQAALIKFLSENIQYPEAAKNQSAEGLVVVTFVVDEMGKVIDAEGIKTDKIGWRQDFQDEAVRVVHSMPNWEPALQKGKPVKVKFTLPIKFKIQ